MKEKASNSKPLARSEGLIIKELPDEVLVYDLDRDHAHCLNKTAAYIWKSCDGKTSPGKIASALADKFDCPNDERIVWLGLDQLGRSHLMRFKAEPPRPLAGMNRRAVIRALGLAAVAAVPVVTSIVAPTPAQAGTAAPPGTPCTDPVQCSSGNCVSGSCA